MIVQNGEIKWTQRVLIEYIDLGSCLHQTLNMLQVTLLRCDVQSCITLIVLDVQVIFRLDQHLQDVEPLRVLGS